MGQLYLGFYIAAGRIKELVKTVTDLQYLATKAYVRQLERFGGKAAVIFDDFNRWFAGLWQGKALGVTVGWISVALAVVLFWIARRMPKQEG